MAGQSRAADMAVPYVAPAPFVPWYLVGFIGVTNQQLGGLDNILYHTGGFIQFLDEGTFDPALVIGGGVGYRFNEWFRVDTTVEYRGDSDFHGFDMYDFNADGIWDGTNEYSGRKSEFAFLANAYVDFGTWNRITPFIGAGIGTSRNSITGFTDVNATNGGVAYADSDAKWDFAWALYAGVGWNVTEAVSLDLTYRYMDLGNARTGDLVASNGVNTVYNPMIFNDITSHDIVLGLRYSFM